MDGQMVKCGGCEKNKNIVRYSANAIKRYQESLRKFKRTNNPRDVRPPLCHNCSPQQRHELKCSKCGIVKGFDEGFAKAQRRNPDNAECKDCVQEREDREPNHREEVEEQEIMAVIESGRPPTAFTSGRSTIFSQSHPSYSITHSRALSTYTESDDGEGWIQPPVEVPEDPRARSTGGSDLSGRVRRLSISSDGTQDTYQSHQTGGTTGTAWDHFAKTYAPYREQQRGSNGLTSPSSVGSRVPNGGFAKQGAVKPDAMTRARIQYDREQRRKQEQKEQEETRGTADSDDDDDSEEDIDKYGY